jgi:permuted papain-like amidase YaeF/Yiix C92 family enzyme
MKPAIAATMGGAVFSVLLGAYLVSYATTVRDPVEWKTGDVIVQDSSVEQTLPVFGADGRGMTHIGIVEARPDGAVVIDAADKVREVPVHEFIAEGKAKAFAVYRIPALSAAQGETVIKAARRQIGKPSDFFLRRSWDALYSSELVRLAYGDIGFDLGRTQRLSSVAKDSAALRGQFGRNLSAEPDCVKRNLDPEACWTLVAKQEIITPSAIVSDSQMTQVYSNLPAPAANAKP